MKGRTVAQAVHSAAAEPFCRFPAHRTLWRFKKLTRHVCHLRAQAGEQAIPHNAADDLIRRLRDRRRRERARLTAACEVN